MLQALIWHLYICSTLMISLIRTPWDYAKKWLLIIVRKWFSTTWPVTTTESGGYKTTLSEWVTLFWLFLQFKCLFRVCAYLRFTQNWYKRTYIIRTHNLTCSLRYKHTHAYMRTKYAYSHSHPHTHTFTHTHTLTHTHTRTYTVTLLLYKTSVFIFVYKYVQNPF